MATAASLYAELLALPGATPPHKVDGEPNSFLGVNMGAVFAIAERNADLAESELVALLRHPVHEARVLAMKVMYQATRGAKAATERRKALYELYLAEHGHINRWDLVDSAAPYVLGRWLEDKPRKPLYDLARGRLPMQRRSAIVATYYFIKHDDIDDTFRIAELLAGDADYYVQLAVGSWIREAGKRDPGRLFEFVRAHARLMPPKMFSYAVERLSKEEKAELRSLRLVAQEWHLTGFHGLGHVR